MTAARTGKVDAMKVLLARGAKVNVKETLEAADGADVGGARRQRRGGASCSSKRARTISDRSIFGWTPLLFAARQGQVDDDHGARRRRRQRQRHLAGRHQRARHRRSGPQLRGRRRRCCEHGVDPNASGQGWTALHQIAWSRRPQRGQNNPGQKPQGNLSSLDLARKLVEHGADINARQTKEPNSDMEGRNSLNRYGATPFFLAAKSVRRPDDAGAARPRRRSVHRQRRRRHAADGGGGRRRLLSGREPGRARGVGRCGEDAAGPRRAGQRRRTRTARRRCTVRPGAARTRR